MLSTKMMQSVRWCRLPNSLHFVLLLSLQTNQVAALSPPNVDEANAVTIPPQVANDLLQAIQSLVLAIKSDGKHKTKSVGPSKPQTKYCWTHGICSHAGADCKAPSEGHVKTATLAAPVGGNTALYVYKYRTK